MTERKFTPGEWQVTLHDGGVKIYDDSDRLICQMLEYSYEEQQANARLIAAAPEMYEALRRIQQEGSRALEQSAEPWKCDVRQIYNIDLVDKLTREALAKAEEK